MGDARRLAPQSDLAELIENRGRRRVHGMPQRRKLRVKNGVAAFDAILEMREGVGVEFFERDMEDPRDFIRGRCQIQIPPAP